MEELRSISLGHSRMRGADLFFAPLVARKDNDRLLALNHSLPQDRDRAFRYFVNFFNAHTDIHIHMYVP